MSIEKGLRTRLDFLATATKKESAYLEQTDSRLFSGHLTTDNIQTMIEDPTMSERLEAFIGRFGRLQDMLGDKFLPSLLTALAEPKSSALENLDRAEKLGLIESANQWLEIRKLRNQMVHEYIDDLEVLRDALNAGHDFVTTLLATTDRMIGRWREVSSRF